MALGISTALRTEILGSLCNESAASDFFDDAILEIRSGTRPASADTAPAGSELASITLPADAFAAAAAGSVAKTATAWTDASATATGTASWFRFKRSGDAGTTNTTDRRIDGTVTATAGGGDIELLTVSIVATGAVTISTATLTLPA